MASDILPFPPDINRELFGAWLSGFVAGEGCFFLRLYKGFHPDARLDIRLRADERPIMELIQSYFQCGRITRAHDRKTTRNQNPLRDFLVGNIVDLHNIVVPHFRRFPLFARKKNDFLIWERAVILRYTVTSRGRQYKLGYRGSVPGWTQSELAQFSDLVLALKEARRYS